MVSILLAVRNEEANILSCLAALANVLYSAEQFEVLIGEDASEDRTACLIKEFIKDKPHFHLIPITFTLGQARGKANVLAQLALAAKGDFFLFTDADVQVPAQWIQVMLSACEQNVGIVMGTTLITGKPLFDKFQSLDWVLAQALLKMASDAGLPLTAMGNNMLVTREAYEATGGYENLPFSVTEDHALCREIISKNYRFKHIVHPQVLAFTQPMPTVKDLLQQRKRWMVGAMQLPFFVKLILLVQALFLPVILLLLFIIPVLAIGIWLLKMGIQSGIMLWMLLKLKQFRLIPYMLLFEPYNVFISFVSLIYYYMSGKLLWKGREYSMTRK